MDRFEKLDYRIKAGIRDVVTNEQLSMMTAAKCGIEVPQSFI